MASTMASHTMSSPLICHSSLPHRTHTASLSPPQSTTALSSQNSASISRSLIVSTPQSKKKKKNQYPAFPSVMDINQIREILPHCFPFLLVDRVIEYNPGVSVVAIKNNECWTQAMAQVGGIVMLQPDVGIPRDNFFFAGIDGVRFRKPSCCRRHVGDENDTCQAAETVRSSEDGREGICWREVDKAYFGNKSVQLLLIWNVHPVDDRASQAQRVEEFSTRVALVTGRVGKILCGPRPRCGPLNRLGFWVEKVNPSLALNPSHEEELGAEEGAEGERGDGAWVGTCFEPRDAAPGLPNEDADHCRHRPSAVD
ncbi:hypothetical protein HYC85_009850 [Camellia sinensis]|uniref:Uncharacterized protein n=1 Tax=Camellia sinensis TaxID=4442 RepID=A0A7J7HJ13_CAMSI|nr:hypothetical protein HYC85_009850 [Camellia sinensis]